MLKATVESLNGFAHPDAKNASGVCGYGREKNEFLIAAFAASFDSSQDRCVVTPNVMRHLRRAEYGEATPAGQPEGYRLSLRQHFGEVFS